MKSVKEFIGETAEAGQSAVNLAIDDYKKTKKVSSDQMEAMQYASGFTVGYITAGVLSELFDQFKKQLKVALWFSAISWILLLTLGAYVWFSLGFSSFTVFLTIWLTALIAVTLALLKGLKYWSEAKKNLAEAQKIKASYES